jgi:Concanavalin A-like lectin/glucanases superfamily
MILPASYLNGFAPRDGQPLYPSLWTGCVGAWNPGLGPSGLVLRDQSGLGNNGTLTGGPTWAANRGRYAMNLDGVDDYVSCASRAGDAFRGAAWSFSEWVFLRSNTSFGGIISMDQNPPYVFSFRDTFGVGAYSVICDGAAILTDSGTITLSMWTHFAVVRNALGSELYRNGIRVATGLSGTISSNSDLLLFGTDYQPNNSRHINGQIDDIRIYSRRISPDEIRTLATRRGIAYEMAPRRRSSSAVVTTNRLRRALIGS